MLTKFKLKTWREETTWKT